MDNKIETKIKTEIMLAYVDGKEIEAKDRNYAENAWGSCAYPSWDWSKNEYRVKNANSLSG